MQTQFKVWDKVMCVKWSSRAWSENVEEWVVYEVLEINDKKQMMVWWVDTYWLPGRFELVKEEQREPKQGDIVEVSRDLKERSWDYSYLFTHNDWRFWVVSKHLYNYQWAITIAMAKYIRPSQPKDTLKSLIEEMKTNLRRLEYLGVKHANLEDIAKRMEQL